MGVGSFIGHSWSTLAGVWDAVMIVNDPQRDSDNELKRNFQEFLGS